MRPRILIVDNEELTCNLLKTELERHAHGIVFTAHRAKPLPTQPHIGELSVLIVDPSALNGQGLIFAEKAREIDPTLKLIVITEAHEKERVLKALRGGYSDYFEKPLNAEEVANSVKLCLNKNESERAATTWITRLEVRVQRTEGSFEDRLSFISKARAMETVNSYLDHLKQDGMKEAGDDPAVLITGERGVGKEWIARMIHRDSRRKAGPWISFNCSQYSGQALEIELFGHEKAAFPGAEYSKVGVVELAHGGTLFLERIDRMDSEVQLKLVKALKDKVFRRFGSSVDQKWDIRIISTSEELLKDKYGIESELYQHMGQVTIHVPTLADRQEDIIPMATAFAERCFRSQGKRFEGFSSGLQNALVSYEWPGNALELYNAMERVSVLKDDQGVVNEEDFLRSALISHPVSIQPMSPSGRHLRLVPPNTEQVTSLENDLSYTALKKKWCDSFEKEYLILNLNRHKGNVSAAAREAKLDRSNFLRLLRRHGLKAQEYRSQPEVRKVA